MGLSRTTLRKHFAAELTAGACRRRMEVLTGLFRAACRGKASAAIAYLRGQPEALRTAEKSRAPTDATSATGAMRSGTERAGDA